jgi:hypothetical protein
LPAAVKATSRAQQAGTIGAWDKRRLHLQAAMRQIEVQLLYQKMDKETCRKNDASFA